MDTADFPQALSIGARIDQSRPWTGGLATCRREIELSEVDAVYCRAPGAFVFPEAMSGSERRFAGAQARAGLGGVINALDGCRWVSHPAAMARAEYKPVQLSAAREAGLRIAPTLVTNRADDVRAFAEEMPGPIVCKPLSSPVLIESDELKVVYTRKLTARDLGDLAGIGTTARLFQAWLDKAYEIRLTVVGDAMFAAEVHAGSKAAHEDWRTDYGALSYVGAKTPPHIAEGVQRLMQRRPGSGPSWKRTRAGSGTGSRTRQDSRSRKPSPTNSREQHDSAERRGCAAVTHGGAHGPAAAGRCGAVARMDGRVLGGSPGCVRTELVRTGDGRPGHHGVAHAARSWGRAVAGLP
nr:hypothetical protein [Streptomyces inusitatus]